MTIRATNIKGSIEVGGSCVELSSGDTRIIIDVGSPLPSLADEAPNPDPLPSAPGLFQGDDRKPSDGVLISHAHLDHYGLLEKVKPEIPKYMTRATHDLIELTRTLLSQEPSSPLENVRVIKEREPFNIGPFEITAWLMDHSAFGAQAFVVRAGEKTVIYSGDFRKHGRKGWTYDAFLDGAPKEADALILEGTTLGRPSGTQKTEDDLQAEVESLLKAKKPVCLYCSGQNIDRLVTFYKACQKTGRTLVVDSYTALVLNKVAESNPRIPHPSKRWKGLRVYFPRISSKIAERLGEKTLYDLTPSKIEKEDLNDSPSKVALLVRPSVVGFIERHLSNFRDGILIYSLWRGYQKTWSTGEFISFMEDRGFEQEYIHTSGHADEATLLEVVDRLNPIRVVPIHTEHPELYKTLFGAKACLLKDGEVLSL